jgi:hypothetical protein
MIPRIAAGLRGALVFAVMATPAAAQQVVELKNIRNHIGQRVTVEAKVADTRRQRDGQVWLSLDRPYPSGPLVIVLTRDVLNTMQDYAILRGKWVRVTGTVRPSNMEGPPPATASAGQRMPDVFAGPSKPFIELEDSGRLQVVPAPPEP